MSRPIAKVEPNLIDKIVTVFNPAAGARRQRARSMLAISGAWTGARYDRRETRDWSVSRGSADADTLYDLPTMRFRSRDLFRNDPIGGGAINNVVKKAIGTGLVAHPSPDADVLGWDQATARAWAKKTKSEFAMWAESTDCDATRTDDFYGLQILNELSELMSGDVFALLPMISRQGSVYKTCVQLIEADRVHSPFGEGQPGKVAMNGAEIAGTKVYGGVEVDAVGAPTAYYILRRHPGEVALIGTFEWDRYPAFGAKTGRRVVLHNFLRERPDQRRGTPFIAPVIELLKQLSRFTEAELMAAVITAMFTVFVTHPGATDGVGSGLSAAMPNGVGDVKGDVKLGNGLIVDLEPGAEVSFADTLRPNTAFQPFVEAILRQIGMRLNIPFEVLTMHFTASYSAARASLLEAWTFFNQRRSRKASGFCQPCYQAWMDEAVSIGRIEAPGYFADPVMRRAYQKCDWVGDAPGEIDPLKAINAAKARIDAGVSTLEIECVASSGREWADIHPQRVAEHQARVEGGLEPAILNATANELIDPNAPEDPEDANDPGAPKKPNTPPPPARKKAK